MKHRYNLHPWMKPLLSVGFLLLCTVLVTKISVVSAAVNETNPILFTVNIPAIFRQNITATNILYSLNGGAGFSVTSDQTPTLTNTGVLSLQGETGKLSLTAGDGIALEGLKVINTGIKSLSSGDGISVSGNQITNSGIVSLTAGDGISVSGNQITNNQVLPDYTLSGWTKTGAIVSLTTPTDSVDMNSVTFGDALITNGKSIIPASDLSVDLGSSALRFDSLYVANINSNSSQSFSGQTTFSYPPKDSTSYESTVLIDPLVSSPSGQLLGLSVNGFQKAFFDIAGNLTLGYSGLASAPVTNNPLNIYGHGDSLVASFDTAGNLTMGNTLTPTGGTLNINSNLNTQSLNVDSGTLSVTDKVGIGTTNPTQMLTVDGGLDTLSLLSPNLINRTSENTRINFDSTTTSLITNGNTGIFLDSTGNVGIGTTEPNGYKLNVAGTANIQGAVTATDTLNIQGQTTLAGLSAGTTNIAGSLTLNGPINSVSGFLGLGTLTPSSQLDIQAAYGTSALSLTNGGNTILGMDAATNGLAMNLTTADPTNRLQNGTFETGLANWTGTQPYLLRDEFSDSGPTTLVSGVSTLTNGGAITPAVGAEMWDAPASTFDSGIYHWNPYSPNTITNDNNSLKVTYVGHASGASLALRNTADLSSDLTLGSWYVFNFDSKVSAGGGVGVQVNNHLGQPYSAINETSNTFTNHSIMFRSLDAPIDGVQMTGSMATGEVIWLDNFSLKPLTLSSLFSTVNAGNQDVVVSASTTLTSGTQAGIVLNLDSTSNPENFVIAYHDGTNMHLDKAVSGTYTALINTATTYVAGANITVRKNGTRYTLVYNGTQVGSDQTISDAGIINNTIHGLFSTYAGNSFSNFSITTNLDGTLATDGVNARITDGNTYITNDTIESPTYSAGRDHYPLRYSGLSSLFTQGRVFSTRAVTGMDTGFSGGSGVGWFSGGSIIFSGGYTQVNVDSSDTSSFQDYAIVGKSSGAYYFKRVNGVWKLFYQSSSGAWAGNAAFYQYRNRVASDYLHVPTSLWLPTPLAYDTFTRNDGALGYSETSGPDTQTTPSTFWTGPTWTISGNKAINTPTLGDELWDIGASTFDSGTYSWAALGNNTIENDNGSLKINYVDNGYGAKVWLQDNNDLSSNLMLGGWYKLSLTARTNAGSALLYIGSAIPDVNRSLAFGTTPTVVSNTFRASTSVNGNFLSVYGMGSTTSSVWYDNISLKPMALNELISSVITSTPSVIASVNISNVQGHHSGLATNLNSSSNPNSGIVAYLNFTQSNYRLVIDKFTSPTTWTNILNQKISYSADGNLTVITDNSIPGHLKLRAYYNNALIGSEIDITDASIINNTIHGLFSTYEGNTFDNFTLWSRGTGGEYNDIPADDLTVTQDTSIKRSGTASVKLVADSSNASFLQSVTVGDTNSYTLTAYAFEATSSAVTTSDVELWYDTATIPTTYSDIGGGWYRLQGTITGSTEPKDVGVRVKAGKTIYLDNITLTSGISTPTTMYVFNSSTGKANLNVQGLIDGTLSGIATFSKAGTISDSDFTSTASGMLAVDTLNHRLYFREGAGWSYIARTGGFQIPAEEVGDMQERDLLLPYVESKMSDGALHGLYTKLSDIMTGGTATISKYTDHVDIKFTKPFSSTPVINISLVNDSTEEGFLTEGHEATVTDLSPTGFSIYLSSNALRDYTYSWTVLQIPTNSSLRGDEVDAAISLQQSSTTPNLQ